MDTSICECLFCFSLYHIIANSSIPESHKKCKIQKNPGNLAVPGHLTLQYDTHEVYTKIYNYYLSISDYSMIEATRPDPTVRPPSRIAKVRPCSIAIGWISSIVISMLSPGIHISVPSGRLQTPVTSVVLK